MPPAIGYGAANAHRGTVTDVAGGAGMLDWRDVEQRAPELALLRTRSPSMCGPVVASFKAVARSDDLLLCG